MKTIVVGFDDSEPSVRALRRAATLAQAFGGALIVTTVAPDHARERHSEPHPLPRLELAGPSELWDHATAGPDVDRSQQTLANAEAIVRDLGLEAEFVAPVGRPADAIVALANERGADVIVVGTREPGVLERLVAHSVSGEVSRHARCDVLIVR